MSKTTILIRTLFLLIAGVSACREHSSSEEVLAEAVRKIRDSPAIQYDYTSYWDNRFNESTYIDSAQVSYFRIPVIPHGKR